VFQVSSQQRRKAIRAVLQFALLTLLFTTQVMGQEGLDLWGKTPAVPSTPQNYHPITASQRADWFVGSLVGPQSMVGGVISAGWGTAFNRPPEYGTHWDGFGQRYGMRLTGLSVGNATEAALGAAWGEDPRYFRLQHGSFGRQAGNIFDLTFRAYQRDGERHVAYARLIGIFGNNFLSNTWRVQSESDWQHALIRSGEGIGLCAASNAVQQFLPIIWHKLHHPPANPNP
jgi:hypothetical protein